MVSALKSGFVSRCAMMHELRAPHAPTCHVLAVAVAARRVTLNVVRRQPHSTTEDCR